MDRNQHREKAIAEYMAKGASYDHAAKIVDAEAAQRLASVLNAMEESKTHGQQAKTALTKKGNKKVKARSKKHVWKRDSGKKQQTRKKPSPSKAKKGKRQTTKASRSRNRK